jgi:predicted TIM-barrel fold metal-dependent hydrolase
MREVSRRELLQMTAAVSTLSSYRILDPHVHVWKHDPRFSFASGAKVPGYDATPEMLLDLMHANGVSKTVIIQVIHYRYDNRYLESVLKQYPQYFLGVCRVDPLDPAAPDQLFRYLGATRFQRCASQSRRRTGRRLDSRASYAAPLGALQ